MPRGLSLVPVLVGIVSIFLGYTYVQQQVNMAGTGEVKELNSPCELVHTPLYETKKVILTRYAFPHSSVDHKSGRARKPSR
jgi:hypothetical protein